MMRSRARALVRMAAIIGVPPSTLMSGRSGRSMSTLMPPCASGMPHSSSTSGIQSFTSKPCLR
ncbi:hypothetical protein D3C83_249320 [compost metagenome]